MKKISVFIQAAFYIFAGANHFINPDFYLPLIPEYFMFPESINYISGFLEILFGLMLMLDATRKISSYLIILMLCTFIPSHVYFIQIGGCIDGGLCAPEWVGWFRLFVIHPLLIWWAWSVRNYIKFVKPKMESPWSRF